MRNIALFLTYLGTDYHGWQVQKNLPTVAETMEKAAAMVVGHPVHMTGCGRTDAGVHARCYVANFRTTSRIPVERLPYALNTHLPCDIVVKNRFEIAKLKRRFWGGNVIDEHVHLARRPWLPHQREPGKHAQINIHPPSGWFFICGHSPLILQRPRGRNTVWQPHKIVTCHP